MTSSAAAKYAPDSPSRAGSLHLVGGVLALDFANTSSGRGGAMHLEHLRRGADVVDWAGHAGVLRESEHTVLARRLAGDVGLEQEILTRGVILRDVIYGIARSIANISIANPAEIGALGGIYAACIARGRLAHALGRHGWVWDTVANPVEAVLGPVALSAVTLVTREDVARVKQCGGAHCGWLFLDTTKNASRRWCDMAVCGNRAKQKRRGTATSRSSP